MGVLSEISTLTKMTKAEKSLWTCHKLAILKEKERAPGVRREN